MNCPICYVDAQDQKNCGQCGSDLQVHRILNKLQVKGDIMDFDSSKSGIKKEALNNNSSYNNQYIPTHSSRGGPSWLWVFGVLNATAVVVLFFLFYQLNKKVLPISAVQQRQAVSSPLPQIEQMQSMTALLTAAFSLITDQRREIFQQRIEVSELRKKMNLNLAESSQTLEKEDEKKLEFQPSLEKVKMR